METDDDKQNLAIEEKRFCCAYSDIILPPQGPRDLEYRSGIWVSNVVAASWFSLIPGYNNFDGPKFAGILLDPQYNELKFKPAREGSVAVYVLGKKKLITQLFEEICLNDITPDEYADLSAFEGTELELITRFWWD